MNRIRQTYLKALLLLTMALLGGTAADAANRLYIDDFTIESYDARRVNVMFDFDDDIAALNFDVVLPEGLTMVGEPVKNPDVFAQGQTLQFNPANNRVLVVSMQKRTFIGKSGVLCSFNVQAQPGMLESNRNVEMKLSRIALATPEASEINVPDAVAQITLQAADVAATSSLTDFVINPGGSREIGVGMDNSVTAVGAQLEIRLPQGFSVKNEAFNLTSRGGNGALVAVYPLNGANGYRLVISDFSGAAAINGNSGDFVKFEVEAPADFSASEALIEITGLKISGRNNQSFSGTPCTIKVVNGKDAYTKAMAETARLEQLLADALTEISTAAPDVKDSFKGEEISTDIQSLKDAIQTAYEDLTLNADYNQVMLPVAAIEAAIAKLMEDAKAAQKAYDDEVAAEAARQEAYKNATAQISALEQKLAEALTVIATEAADVKDSFKGTDIKVDIDALKAAVEKAYADKTIVSGYDSLMAPVPAIESAIAKLVEDAKAAQKEYEDEVAAEAARQEAYKNATAQISALEQKLAEALTVIATEAADVKDSFKGTDIKVDIDALKAAVEKAYADKTIVSGYDSLMAPVPAIESAIAKLVEDAKAAQKAYEENAALAAALDNANERLAGLEKTLADALVTIAADAPDVKGQFSGVEITAQIAALREDVLKAFNDKSLVEKYAEVMTPAAAIESAIAKLVEDAKAAQKAYEAEQARQAANLAAYEADLKTIEGLQTKLDQTVDNIRTLFPAFDVDTEKKAAQDAISAQKEQAEDAYMAVAEEGTYKNTVDTAAIEKMIADLLANAKNSGVEEILGEDIENVVAIYTEGGMRMKALQQGKINIVVFKDGTSRKVYVK